MTRSPGFKGPYPVAAGVGLQLGGQGNSRTEKEDAVQRVNRDHNDRVQSPFGLHTGRHQVEQSQHGERSREDGVVDGARVACKGIGDHVTDKSHDEERPYELDRVSECATEPLVAIPTSQTRRPN